MASAASEVAIKSNLREGDSLWMERGNGFWRDFRKDQDYERQRQGGDRNAGVAKKSDSNDCCDSRGQNVDQVVANQNQPDQSVGSLQKSDGSSRSAVTVPLRCFRR